MVSMFSLVMLVLIVLFALLAIGLRAANREDLGWLAAQQPMAQALTAAPGDATPAAAIVPVVAGEGGWLPRPVLASEASVESPQPREIHVAPPVPRSQPPVGPREVQVVLVQAGRTKSSTGPNFLAGAFARSLVRVSSAGPAEGPTDARKKRLLRMLARVANKPVKS